ncbi:hypothetical protein VPHD273_0072 [Vibrio phage D273]
MKPYLYGEMCVLTSLQGRIHDKPSLDVIT